MRLIKVEGLSQREASQRAGTEHSFSASRCENIRRRIGRALTPQESKPRPRLLDDKMEEMLYSVVQAFSTLANPLGTTEVQVLAQALSGMDQVPSTGWVQKFLIRHGNEIALRKGKKSHKRKDLLATFTSVKQWTEDTSNVLKGLALQPSLVFNIDETRAVPASKTVSVLAHKHMTETHYNQTIDSALYTLVSCIAADGTTLFCLYMFKYIPNKNGLRHSVYLPVEAPKRVSRRKHDYPVYIAVSPKGYMNGELWQETMKIFIELAGNRQGLGRQKQALLFIDGCASHLRDWTVTNLSNENISTVYFPANSSHVLQPADGEVFANYKQAARANLQSSALKASITGELEKELTLLECIQSHSEAVTPSVVKAAFRNRGIWPWDPPLALANAHIACPTLRIQVAHDNVYSAFLAQRMVIGLQEKFSKKANVERKMIEVVNSPTKSADLESWKPRPRTPAKKANAMKPRIELYSSDGESELMDFSETESDTSKEAPIIQSVISSSSANICSHCGHTRSKGTVPLACLDCSQFWLCMSCAAHTSALNEHQKTHPELEGRCTRRRAIVTISTL